MAAQTSYMCGWKMQWRGSFPNLKFPNFRLVTIPKSKQNFQAENREHRILCIWRYARSNSALYSAEVWTLPKVWNFGRERIIPSNFGSWNFNTSACIGAIVVLFRLPLRCQMHRIIHTPENPASEGTGHVSISKNVFISLQTVTLGELEKHSWVNALGTVGIWSFSNPLQGKSEKKRVAVCGMRVIWIKTVSSSPCCAGLYLSLFTDFPQSVSPSFALQRQSCWAL